MRRLRFTAALLLTSFAAPLQAAEMKAHYDFAERPALLKEQLREDGQAAGVQTVFFEPQGLRFWLETTWKDARKNSLYSVFTLKGDFEISVDFEWRTVTPPKDGYGVSCGISVEAQGKHVALARGVKVGQRDMFIITKKVPKKEFENDEFPTKATKGKLVLRREKTNVICLASEGDGPLEELGDKIPFTGATIQKVLFFADPGNAPNALDARLTNIQVRAEEILSDIPLHERQSNLGWWLTLGGLVVAMIAGYLGYRRWQDDKWLWSRG